MLDLKNKRKLTYLKELLNDIISKNINHELVGSLQNLTKDQLTLCRTCSFQLQLNKPEHTHTVFHKYSHVITVQTIAGTSLVKPSCRLVLLPITVLLLNRSKIFVTTNHGGHLAIQHKQDMKKMHTWSHAGPERTPSHGLQSHAVGG